MSMIVVKRKSYHLLLLVLVTAAFLLPVPAGAQEGGVVVSSKLIDGPIPGDDPVSPLWDQEAKAVEFPLSAQVHWEPRLFNATAKTLKVRSLHNGEELAILLEYQDPKKGLDDAAAIEFTVGEEKAHFAHAQPMMQVGGGEVNIWYWKADEAKDMNAKGFGTLKAQDQQDVTGRGVWQDGVWRVVFSRKLETGDEKDVGIVPGDFREIAFAVWDAENREKGSRKAVTSWWYFRAEPPPDQSIWFYVLLAVAGAAVFEVVIVRRIRKKLENV